MQHAVRTGRDLPGALNRGGDVLSVVDRADPVNREVPGRGKRDLLIGALMMEAKRVVEILSSDRDQEASLIARVVDCDGRILQEESGRRRRLRQHAARIAEMIPMTDRRHRSTGTDPERSCTGEPLSDEIHHSAGLGPDEWRFRTG